ncbi:MULTISPECIES: large exoprotein [unclassified Microbacterium]|uniref:large exoprotein n=1 Tax=unclassified Microbacterium TaxID=2609290 RepID=UPI00214BED40|nr:MULTISPECIES: large exoprotein [unclassified Microbacterium]MCR2810573.1 large exoprotein [Microbacterium sp. zg.B185]WIM18111.1 large exoprotein [Microbacterium sp. zg-B185]
MGGQVLGGGVIVLVAVLLWMVYLLPSWHSRRQFDAAERNAVRLNQALRVLAETSETPHEVRLELNARTALAQQRLARRAVAEREQAALEQARIDLAQARDERAAARSRPSARRARARRRTRLALTVLGLVGVGVSVWGAWEVVATGSQLMLWSGVAAATMSGLLLVRMTRVGARAVNRVAIEDASARVPRVMQDVELTATPRTGWAPRELPRPLTVSAGSRAAAMLDAAAAREALRQAAVEEAARQRAAELEPPSIAAVRAARESAEASPYAAMGRVDDAEIEAHVRRLLASRAG